MAQLEIVHSSENCGPK